MSDQKIIDFVVLGGGGRGRMFSEWLSRQAGYGRVVAIAEPVAQRRKHIADLFQISADRQFVRWEDVLVKPKLADAVVNALPDRLHVSSALAAIEGGYHMLLEKPMATSLLDCERIDAARRKAGSIVSICHSLRYHAVYAEVKRILTSGVLGRLMTFDQIEAVEPIHQSHSFVRGNWGNESRSTFMLMAKSCHDIDVLTYLTGKECRQVSSFGALSYFRPAHAPAGAPLRCTDGCPAEHECPYFAPKIYVGPNMFWGADVLLGRTDAEKLEELKTSPYGRCVFRTDNDVVDHQVVNFEYDDDLTRTFTMTAFGYPCTRRLRLNGTHGELQADIEARTIDVVRFADHAKTHITVASEDGSHGGADAKMIRNFVQAIRSNNAELVLTGTAESLRSHRIVFAAELARKEKRVVQVKELTGDAAQKTPKRVMHP